MKVQQCRFDKLGDPRIRKVLLPEAAIERHLDALAQDHIGIGRRQARKLFAPALHQQRRKAVGKPEGYELRTIRDIEVRKIPS